MKKLLGTITLALGVASIGTWWIAHPAAAEVPKKLPAVAAPVMGVETKNDKIPRPPRMRRPQISKAEAIAKLQKEYGYTYKELDKFFMEGVSFGELNTACRYARLAKADLNKVIKLRQNNTWGRVRTILGLDYGSYAERGWILAADKLAAEGKVNRTTALELLSQGYTFSDIQQAIRLSKLTTKNFREILSLRTVENEWFTIAAELGVAEQAGLKKNINNRKGRRSGPGFAGLHMGNLSKERKLEILHNDYQIPIEKIEVYYEQMDFDVLETICLYAYLAEKPLAEIAPLRYKYSWERMQHVLGLTPQIYAERCIEYQARRMDERMDIPFAITKKYMQQGYAMHHVLISYYLEKETDIDMVKIMSMKKPNNKWEDVAWMLGVSAEKLKEIQEKDSAAFGRHN